ncbi:DUF4157 domain-containing protein [Nannocystaceae bacterium ST9]
MRRIVAHGDHAARASARAMGALAFATGEHVAFAEPPSLHTVAHEAAHVIQQRSGVSLQSGLGREGDAFERHADAVADRVTRGESASDLLGSATHGAASPGAQVQCKLKEWPHPSVTETSADGIKAAAKDVKKKAEIIDAAVENGAQQVRDYVAAWGDGSIGTDDLYEELEPSAPSHARNFVNKLIDWGFGKSARARGAAIREAGYVIEEYANARAEANGIETQVTLDGSRPDFRHKTDHEYEQDYETYAAHGLIDATSAAEAAKGHILDKVNRMSRDNALNHPILYDCYYEDLGFGHTPAKPVDFSGITVAQRVEHYKRLAEQGARRKKSLRSASKAGKPAPVKTKATKKKAAKKKASKKKSTASKMTF